MANMNITVRTIETEQGVFIETIISSPQGLSASFVMPPDAAEKIANQYLDQVRQAKTGLLVAGGLQVVKENK